ARGITRENATICGRPWVDEVLRQVDPAIEVTWSVADGDRVNPDQALFTAEGSARSLLTAERTALNFLQTLSGTATRTHHYASLIAHTDTRLLDTRKTLPGLRLAQKYAVACGGGENHRIGLYDAYLIKENHIAACGSIGGAIERARELHADKRIEVEVENLDQFAEAVHFRPDWIMLDNFSLQDLATAVSSLNEDIKLEASGGIENESELIAIAETGVHYISVGALTKHCTAVDLSMRFP
ncbi:MAG: carboxylating nicotinate-nucleotide diphosphorylase, partial [Pseudomonadales bacterium]|nr:carboxylating nicotinate-nucleotide diphosphorylase [Pseudomonadales bacterium]